jgi:hypothetical protein
MAKLHRDVLTAAERLIWCACVFGPITLWVSIGMTATQEPGTRSTGKTQSTTASPTTPAPKAKKVWTNDDLDGSPVSNASRTPLPKNSSGEGATFLTPLDGDVVRPGEVLQVNISVKPGAAEGPISITSEIGDSNEVRQSPPYSFTMTVSRDHSVGAGSPLIGKHSITAFGKLNGRNEYDLASIDLDVEEPQVPTKLSVVSNLSGPGGVNFYAAGQQEYIAIYAQFPNGDQVDVIDSSYLKLVSENPNVVSIGERGTLTSIGPGTTSVIGTYTFQGQTLQVSLPVLVRVPTTGGLIPSPPSLNFGDQPAGRESAPLQVVLTNRSLSTIKIYKPEIRAAVREWDDCTAAPLPPGGICTMSVTFFMIRPGRTQGLIFIPNSQSGQISIAVIGNGI